MTKYYVSLLTKGISCLLLVESAGSIPKTDFHIETFHPFQFPDDEVKNWFQQGLIRLTISILAFKGNVTSRVPNAGWGGVPIPAGIALPSRHILAGTQPSGFIIRQSHWATWSKRFVDDEACIQLQTTSEFLAT